MVGPYILEVHGIDAIVYHKAECLGTDAFVPMGFAYPIAHLAVILADWDIACSVSEVAHGSNGFACFLEDYGPCLIIVEHGADDLATFLYGLMHRPSCTGTYIGIGSVFVQCLGI